MAFPAQAQTINICGRTQQVVEEILRQTPADDACNSVLVSETDSITQLSLFSKGITSLQSGDFSGLSVGGIDLRSNQLNELPAGVFSGLSSPLIWVALKFNPGADFRFTVRFEPKRLEKDFTATEIRVVLREGAPITITVPLSATGTGGALFNSPDSLTIPAGATRSNPATVTPGEGFFRLDQGKPEWFDSGFNSGFEIVRGPPLTVGGVRMKVRVFLEGALE